MGGEKIKYFAYTGIAVFGIAVIYFVISLYITMVNGESRSQSEFSSFVQQSDIYAYSSLATESDVENYYNNIKKSIDENSYILAAIINVAQDPVFAYPISSSVIEVSSENKPVLLSSSPMLKTYSMSLPSFNGQIVVLSAVSYVLRPQDIYNSARVSFLIILAYTLSLIVIIIYSTLTKESSNVTRKVVILDTEDTDTDDTTITTDTNDTTTDAPEPIPVVFREQDSAWDDFFVGTEDSPVAMTEESPVDSDVEPSVTNAKEREEALSKDNRTDEEFESNFVNDFIHESIENDSDTEDSHTDSAPAINEDNTASQLNDPMGLFSDTTGVGWESYLETRLDSELKRSASSEQDLALMFIKIRGIESNPTAKKKVATLLIDYFKYRDFVFEHEKDGFVGIMLDVNLDQTMVLSEELFKHLEYLMLIEGVTAKIGIGISTRSLRILPGSRIIEEASEAVTRAFAEEGIPIVAFRVNPEKYRQYVSNTPL